MAMSAGYGGVPVVGTAMVAANEIELPANEAFTVMLVDVADPVTLSGLTGLVPYSYCWSSALISARRHAHWLFCVISAPESILKGSGSFGFAWRDANEGTAPIVQPDGTPRSAAATGGALASEDPEALPLPLLLPLGPTTKRFDPRLGFEEEQAVERTDAVVTTIRMRQVFMCPRSETVAYVAGAVEPKKTSPSVAYGSPRNDEPLQAQAAMAWRKVPPSG
jgi:hypothetical protein